MKNNVALYFTGLGLGVFLGLSKSPILLQVLVPMLTIVVGLLAILTGQKNESTENEPDNTTLLRIKNINVFPIMWMILGMVSGSIPGMLARNYDIFSPKKEPTVEAKNEKEPEKAVDGSSSILFGDEKNLCSELKLCSLEGAELICVLKDIPDQEIEALINDKNSTLFSIKNKISITCECK